MPSALAGTMSLSMRSPTMIAESADATPSTSVAAFKKALRVGLAETGQPAQALMLEQLADAGARQPLARSLRLVGDNAELEPALAQAAQQAVDPGPELENVEIADHGAQRCADAVDRPRIAAAQGLDHVGVGV